MYIVLPTSRKMRRNSSNKRNARTKPLRFFFLHTSELYQAAKPWALSHQPDPAFQQESRGSWNCLLHPGTRSDRPSTVTHLPPLLFLQSSKEVASSQRLAHQAVVSVQLLLLSVAHFLKTKKGRGWRGKEKKNKTTNPSANDNPVVLRCP